MPDQAVCIDTTRHTEIIRRRMCIPGQQGKQQNNRQTGNDQYQRRQDGGKSQFVLLCVDTLNELMPGKIANLKVTD